MRNNSKSIKRWQESWWLSLFIFVVVFFASFAIPIVFNYLSVTIYPAIFFFAGLISNIVVISAQNYRLWHFFGLVVHKKSLQHLLFGLLLPLVFFIPLLGLLSFWGISLNSITFLNVLYYLYFIGFAAAGEELVFRGVLFQKLIDKKGEAFAIFVTSLVFALLHLMNPNITLIGFVNIFLAGVVLGLCYVRTSTLWLSIGFHFGWNFWQKFLLNSRVSGLDWGTSIFQTKIMELNPIIFGGDFGIEGGLVTTLFLLISAYIVAKKFIPVPEVYSRILREKYTDTPIQ
ncbi:MAG: lysostaphin resistance A-like protein [Candidatus Kapaibacteriota bacterium]